MLAVTLICMNKERLEAAGISSAGASAFALMIVAHMFIDVLRHWREEDYPISARLAWIIAATLHAVGTGITAFKLLSVVWN